MPNRPRRRRTALLSSALVLTVAASLSACSDSGTDEPGSQNGSTPAGGLASQKLDWSKCPAPDDTQGGGTAPSPLPGGTAWQCATMKAPLDWDAPDGDTLDLALVRARSSAKNEDQRIGSLIFNFGGPGGSGVSTLPAFGDTYETLRGRYDLVSFDPRGVGRSAPVTCLDDTQLDDFFQADSTPDDAAERADLMKRTQQFNAACEKNSGKVLPQVTTTDAARDMDLMRQVLGDEKLYYMGISYGTELGGVYAHLFPEKVGRAVFDAVVDPTQDAEQGSLGQAKGFQLALDNYAEACTATTEECPVGSDPADVKKRIADLLASLDKKPLPADGDRELTQAAALNGIAQSLYSEDFWEYLTQGLEDAYDGDGRILLALSDSMTGRNQDGTYSNLQAANIAINCADDKPRYTEADVREKLPEFRKASPVFGDFLAWGLLSCTDWPVAGAAEHPDVSAEGSAPIVVIGNTGDPATPYEGARQMARALGKGVGVEITYKGQGHGAYDSGNACVRKAVDGYLLDGTVPKNGTVCS
ncbi:alpha/beta fold hydrolase [Streptomyces diastaticus]|uniref:alpha/beta hydrolase n=1 Tax=Streptomyces diastaticus TaxID=1956 RepID=UPI0036574F79